MRKSRGYDDQNGTASTLRPLNVKFHRVFLDLRQAYDQHKACLRPAYASLRPAYGQVQVLEIVRGVSRHISVHNDYLL